MNDRKWTPDPDAPGWEVNDIGSRRWKHGDWTIEIIGEQPHPVDPRWVSVYTTGWDMYLGYDPEDGTYEIEHHAPYDGTVRVFVPREVIHQYEKVIGLV